MIIHPDNECGIEEDLCSTEQKHRGCKDNKVLSGCSHNNRNRDKCNTHHHGDESITSVNETADDGREKSGEFTDHECNTHLANRYIKSTSDDCNERRCESVARV